MSLREIQIRRREPKSHLPNPIVNDAVKKIGSIFDGQAPLRGLTRADEEKYLPRIIGSAPDERDWNKKVLDYWADFSLKVESQGLVLNITMMNHGTEEEPLEEPINLKDWISYQWCLRHALVAANEADLRRNVRKEFYIFDPREADKVQNKQVKSKLASYKELIRLVSSGNRIRMNQVLRVISGINPELLSEEQMQNRLESAVATDSDRFYEVVTDKDLEVRFEIDELLEHGVLDRLGNHIMFDGDPLGHTTDEAIL